MRSKSTNKDSILAITFLLLLLFIFSRQIVFIYTALVFIIICLLSPAITGFFDSLWKSLSNALGLVSGTVILSVLFYLLVLPLGILLRMMNKSPLLLNSRNSTTTFITRHKLFTGKDLQNPY